MPIWHAIEDILTMVRGTARILCLTDNRVSSAFVENVAWELSTLFSMFEPQSLPCLRC